MQENLIAIFLVLVLLLLSGLALIMLIRPSSFLRHFANSLQPDTTENRVHVRGLGIFVFLFLLGAISTGMPDSALHHGFQHNILIALALSPILLAIFLWVLWRFSVRDYVRRLQIEGMQEDPAWERRMTLIFCALLLFITAIAFVVRVPW